MLQLNHAMHQRIVVLSNHFQIRQNIPHAYEIVTLYEEEY